MAKKKVKANTLVGFWQNINKIAPSFLDSKSKITQKSIKEIQGLIEEVNSSPVPASIASGFVAPYMHKDQCQVEFSGETSTEFGSWAVKYNKDDEEEVKTTPKLYIDPIGLHKYITDFKNAENRIDEEPELKKDFKEYRQISFMKAIAKMPEPYFIYIAVLQEIAKLNDIVSIENREGGYIKSDASFYLSVLWAFKEFERFYLRVQHRHLRADYGIIWHEGEWIEDRKTKGYV